MFLIYSNIQTGVFILAHPIFSLFLWVVFTHAYSCTSRSLVSFEICYLNANIKQEGFTDAAQSSMLGISRCHTEIGPSLDTCCTTPTPFAQQCKVANFLSLLQFCFSEFTPVDDNVMLNCLLRS